MKLELEGKLIYLASPYTCKDAILTQAIDVERLRYQETVRACAALMKSGVMVYSGIVYGVNICQEQKLPATWEFWKKLLVTFLSRSQELWVLMIDGWTISEGVAGEVAEARRLGIPVRYLLIRLDDSWELYNEPLDLEKPDWSSKNL